MHRTLFLILSSLLFMSNPVFSSEAFGPRENKLVFSGNSSSISYSISNSGKNIPWLVQAWVEDYREVRTNDFATVPLVFRVEPASQFNVRIVKNGNIPEDRESVYWVVSNSIPGRNEKKVDEEKGKITAELSLAYKFKVPMIYRPSSLEKIKKDPQALLWTSEGKDIVKIYNPTRFAMQINHVTINGQRKQGDGISYIIPPLSGTNVSIDAGIGTKITYGVTNDFGAVKEYEGVVK
ncbi:TPA: molecular chaperone [Klebsiella oxytoca]|nr:molecular chaperone [Klebsiella oxytoca]